MTSEQWTELRANKWANEKPPTDWPTGVRPVSLDGTGLFGIGPDNRLYWDGQLQWKATTSADSMPCCT